MDVISFVDSLLKSEPKSKKSIQLTLDLENNSDEDIFNFLIETFTIFMKKNYGNNINLDNIDNTYVNKIQEYFNSFGFKIEYFIYKNNEDINYKGIPKSKLGELYLNIKCEKNSYRIMFDYI